jgi:hypothetical protein
LNSSSHQIARRTRACGTRWCRPCADDVPQRAERGQHQRPPEQARLGIQAAAGEHHQPYQRGAQDQHAQRGPQQCGIPDAAHQVHRVDHAAGAEQRGQRTANQTGGHGPVPRRRLRVALAEQAPAGIDQQKGAQHAQQQALVGAGQQQPADGHARQQEGHQPAQFLPLHLPPAPGAQHHGGQQVEQQQQRHRHAQRHHLHQQRQRHDVGAEAAEAEHAVAQRHAERGQRDVGPGQWHRASIGHRSPGPRTAT